VGFGASSSTGPTSILPSSWLRWQPLLNLNRADGAYLTQMKLPIWAMTFWALAGGYLPRDLW